MKRIFLILVVLAIAVTGVFASGTRSKSGEADPLCGTWYGGDPNPDLIGYKYHYSFIPTGPDRWYIMAQGIYNPDSLGAAVMSKWTGEVVRSGGVYEMRIMVMTTTDPVDPPDEFPIIMAARGWITVNLENEIETSYDQWGAYTWGTTPFVDEPATWMLPPNSNVITEVLHRIRMDVDLP